VTSDDVLALCLDQPGAWPDQPWGDGVRELVKESYAIVVASLPRAPRPV